MTQIKKTRQICVKRDLGVNLIRFSRIEMLPNLRKQFQKLQPGEKVMVVWTTAQAPAIVVADEQDRWFLEKLPD